MELVDGQPITAWCDARSLSIPDRLTLFLKVCDAVRFAHANLVLHRDIKPANVLVDASGGPKLIDFGIAKPLTALDATVTGLQLFSPSNAAPEQLRGERCGVACDVYQLGTLLYELLTGATVLGGSNISAAEIETAILHRVPTRPSEVVERLEAVTAAGVGLASTREWSKALQGDLDTVVMHALRKEPEQRYASVEQLADEIVRHQRNEPIAARGGERRYRLRKFARRHREAIVVTGAVVLLALAFVATLVLQAQRLQQERDTARNERDRAQAISHFLAGVFGDADPAKSLGRNVPIGQVIDRGRQRLARELEGQPDLSAPLLGVIAEVYVVLNDAKTAVELIDEGERQMGRATGIDERTRAEFLLRVARVRHANGQFDLATAAARETLAIQERLGDGAARRWPAQSVLFGASLQRQDMSTWKQPLAEALRAIESDPEATPLELALARKNIGHSFTFLDELEESERLQRQAYATLQELLPPDDPELTAARYGLGVLLTRAGKGEEAVPLMRQVVDAWSALYGPQTMQVARGRSRLAEAQMAAGHFDDALASALSALETQRSLKGGRKGDTMVLEDTVAETYEKLGRLDEAETHYREAMRLQDEIVGVNGGNSVEIRTGLASVLAKQGRHAEAAQVLAQCASSVTFISPLHARWGVQHAESLHALGRDDEARALLERSRPFFASHAKALADERDRFEALVQATAGPGR